MNQNPEQIARDNIDTELLRCGWVIQNEAHINLIAALGVVVRECQSDIGLAVDMIFAKAFKANLSVMRLISWVGIVIFKSPWTNNNIKSVQVGH